MLGIGVSFIIEATFNLVLKLRDNEAFRKVITENNITLANLTIVEKAQFQMQSYSFSSSLAFLAGAIMMGFALIIFSILLYARNNSISYNRKIFSYELKKGKKILSIVGDFEENTGEILRDYGIKTKIIIDEKSGIKLRFYPNFFTWLLYGNDFNLSINKLSKRIMIYCANNKLGQRIEESLTEYIRKNKIFKNKVMVSRD